MADTADTVRAREPGLEDARRILVLANETCEGAELFRAVQDMAGGAPARVHLVAPALTSALRFWASDEDGGAARAAERARDSAAAFAEHGITVSTEVGDADPLVALNDAVRTFAPDEVLIATHPPARESWLEAGLVPEARAAVGVPVTHVTVDRAAHAASVVPEAAERPAPRAHTLLDVFLVGAAFFLAVIGSLILVAVVASTDPSVPLMLAVLALDLGLKALAGWLLWFVYLRRPRADRLEL